MLLYLSIGLSSTPLWTLLDARLGPDTVFESGRGEFDDGGYSPEVNYSNSDNDSDSG